MPIKRHAFEVDPLIYVPSRRHWYSSSSCMWTKSTRIAGRIAIASDFSELEDFFLDVLEVEVPDKSTNIMELEALCQVEKTPSISQVKALLWEINSWEPSHNDLDPLRPLKAFPVLG